MTSVLVELRVLYRRGCRIMGLLVGVEGAVASVDVRRAPSATAYYWRSGVLSSVIAVQSRGSKRCPEIFEPDILHHIATAAAAADHPL